MNADDLLARFTDAGMIGVPDVRIAERVVAMTGSCDRVDPPVALVLALAVRALRAGSVCVDLNALRDIPPDSTREADRDADPADQHDLADLPWPDPEHLRAAVAASPLTPTISDSPTPGQLAPIRLVRTDDGATLLYLDRYFRQESRVREVLAERARGWSSEVSASDLDRALERFFPPEPTPGSDLQRAAAAAVARHHTTVLAGGPGTGKTYTAARIVAVVAHLLGPDLRVAVCAPTGRAAATIGAEFATQNEAMDLPPVAATTLHALLGWAGRSGRRFAHHAGRRLPHDLVIVDESSMVSLTMMYHLLDALRPTTRLVLIGDPDQLASVDAGAVLADLVHRRADRVGRDDPERALVVLKRRRRFGADIAALADAVRAGDADSVVELVAGGSGVIDLVGPDDLESVRRHSLRWVRDLVAAGRAGDARAAAGVLNAYRVLCAHREGPAGVSTWTDRIAGWAEHDDPSADVRRLWYPGRPLLLTSTDRRLGLFNGDAGVVVDDARTPAAVFARGETIHRVRPSRLRGVTTALAMTIHRSQGSQYRHVTVVIPPAGSALLTRELLYTAVTRATDRVTLVGTVAGLRAGVERKVLRASGLRSAVTEI